MKTTTITIAFLALAVSTIQSLAQGDTAAPSPAPGGPPQAGNGPMGPAGDHKRPKPPILAVLDANDDGVIDAAEIASASEALKKLDKNGDGKLTPDEFRPPRPPGGRPGGPRGGGPAPQQSGTGSDQNSTGPGPNPPQQGPGGEHKRPVPPLEKVLDANGDGVIDAAEIANASEALKQLDKNGDGKLTMDEFRPPRPPGGGPGGPQGGGPSDNNGPRRGRPSTGGNQESPNPQPPQSTGGQN